MGLLMSIWRGLCALLGILLGQWSAPTWMRWCGDQLVGPAQAVWSRLRAQPRFYGLWLAGLLVATLAVQQGYQWWQDRPRPAEVTVTVESPGLTEYANEGEPKVPKPIVLNFSASVAPIGAIGKPVTGVTLMPAVEGDWAWADDRQLVFTPRHQWPIAANYKGSLAHSLVAPQVHLANRDFVVSTPSFEVSVLQQQFYQDPVDPAIKKVVVEVGFSHPVNATEFEKRIEMRLAEQSNGLLGIGRQTTPFTVVYDRAKTHASIHSANLPIPKESTTLDLTIAKGVVAQATGPETQRAFRASVPVPGLYALSVEEVRSTVVSNEQFEPERLLLIRTSQSVLDRDLAKQVSAWVLPEFKPGVQAEVIKGRVKLYNWPDVGEVTDKVLAESTRLDLTPTVGEREHGKVQSFKFKADVGRVLYVQVAPQLKSFGGYLLPKRSARTLTVPPFAADLHIMSQGALLPISGEKKVAVVVRDLPGLKIEIGRVQPNQLQHLVSQAQGGYATPAFLGRFNADNITDRFERLVVLPALPAGKTHYESIDLSEYLVKDVKEGEARKGLFLLQVQGYNPKDFGQASSAAKAGSSEDVETNGKKGGEEAPDYSGLRDRRLVLLTDLGIVMKQSVDGGRDVFVQSLYTGAPVEGASVEVVATNGSTLLKASTDSAGHVRFGRLDGFTRERAPLMALVRKAGDMSFLPLNRSERSLDVSRFDVGGLRNERTADQLNAYLFSDRGIYRPGETMRLGMIVRAADWHKTLDGVPLEAEVLDARGLAVKRERLRVGAGGFSELVHTTLESSPTGNYTINVHVIKNGEVDRQIGSTTVKVQEFQPDSMRVAAYLSSQSAQGWVHPKALKARINAQNLFGTPAENRRVEVSMTLSPAWPAFRNFADYSFYDPLRAKEGVSESLPEGRTNDTGDAVFDLNLNRFAKATYRLSLLSKAFEAEDGRSVSAEVTALVSESPYLIGVKHDGDLGYVSMGSQRASHLIAIDPQAKKRAVDGLLMQFIERKSVSVLMRQSNDTYRYESRPRDVVISEVPLNIPQAGIPWTLDTSKAGNFSHVVRDASGQELTRFNFSVAGQGNVTRSLDRNAELQLNLNKSDYMPGDEIEVSIRAPYVGAGLITIERDKVYAQSWFKTTTTASVQKIKLPANFEGNGYVSVHFVRDLGSDEIFMSPLSHGVVPFATNRGARTNTLKIEVPEVSKPGQVLNIKLQSSQRTRAVVFAVDEGVLQVARYKNADPLGHFLQKRALEVKTSQILDLLLPEFKHLMAASAPGGDDAGANARFLNPFKRKGEAPVAYWSGIVDVNGEAQFNYTLPDHFNGALRVMAVAVNDSTVGVAQAQTRVRGDFVLSPNLPLMVSPGDVFDVSVGVANNITDSAADAPVLVSLRVPPTFEVQGAANQTLKLSPMREGVALYKIKVKESQAAALGSATVRFSASLGAKSVSRRVDVSVRPATPKVTTVTSGHFKGSAEVMVPRDLVPEFRKQEVVMSTLPLALTPGLLSHIDNISHQSTEQLVSRALPYLVLARRPELGLVTPENAAKAFEATLRTLRSRQNAQGGFGLWAASVEAAEYPSVYAAHMLLEASEAEVPGVNVPSDMLKSTQAYLQQLASSHPADLSAARTRAYAIYLLTRQGIVTTPLLSSLRESLDAQFKTSWKTDATASLLAATYQMLQQDKPAAELLGGMMDQLDQGREAYRWSAYYDPVLRDAQLLYLVARHFPAKLKGIRADTLSRLMAPLGEGHVNTLSAAYTVLAIEAMARGVNAQLLAKLSAQQVNAKNEASPLSLPLNLMPRAEIAPTALRLNLANETNATVYYSVTQSGFDRSPPAQELKAGMEILREYLDASGKPATEVKMGDELQVRLSLRGIGPTPAASVVPSVALTDLLPGGFEPVQSRNDRGASSTVTGPAIEFADVREDRVIIYTTASPNMQTFTYRIRATNAGDFTAPPAYAESMYERSKQARSVASRLTVSGKR